MISFVGFDLSSVYSDPSFYKKPCYVITGKRDDVKEKCVLRGSIASIISRSRYFEYSRPYEYEIAYRMGYKFARSGKNSIFIKTDRLRNEMHQVEKKIMDCFESGCDDYYSSIGIKYENHPKINFIGSNWPVIAIIKNPQKETLRAIIQMKHEIFTSEQIEKGFL